MSACPNCLKAQTSHTHGGTTAGCDGCNLRGIALSPKHIREHFYEMVRAKDGEEATQAMKRRAAEEFKRIQRLKDRTD